jgi:Leucine-rich repeat (LRR) protein
MYTIDCNTGISSLPLSIGELHQLEGLQADGCPLVAPLNSLYAKDPLLLVKLHDTRLQALDLSEAGLEEVPQALLRLTGLTSLDLHKNAIKVSGLRMRLINISHSV